MIGSLIGAGATLNRGFGVGVYRGVVGASFRLRASLRLRRSSRRPALLLAPLQRARSENEQVSNNLTTGRIDRGGFFKGKSRSVGSKAFGCSSSADAIIRG